MNPKNLSLPTLNTKFPTTYKRRKEKEENFHIDFVPKLSHMSYFTNLLPSIDPEMWKAKVFFIALDIKSNDDTDDRGKFDKFAEIKREQVDEF